MFSKREYKDFDRTLVLLTLLIFLIGCLAIYSATQAKGLPFSKSYLLKQIIWLAVGSVFLLVSVRVSYQKFIDLSYILYGINVILLILVLILGHTRLGAQRWFSIGGFAFQPSEFIKVSFILALSNYIGSHKAEMATLRSLITLLILFAIPFGLVLAQPDLGTAFLLVPMFLSLLLVGGARVKHLMAIIFIGFVSLPLFWQFLREYQKQRLLVFINPNMDPLGIGYNIIQSKIALGSGGLFGKGWLNGTQSQLNFLPEHHTDFIFSVVGEEWGFLGASALIVLFFFVIKRALNIACLTSDAYGRSIAAGIAVMLAAHVIINIGMTIGLMPVVGIPLPLVSYGGSSLITTLFALGLLLNVGMRRSTF